MPTDTARSSRNQHDLFAPPIVLVICPVVENASGVVAAEPADQTDDEEGSDAGEGRLVEDGQVLALFGESSEQKDGQCEEGIECSLGQGSHDRIHFEALTGQ